MKCPRCMIDFKSFSSNGHYTCPNKNCIDDKGARTEFVVVQDTKIRFPHNQIFVNRRLQEFYRKPYLEIKPLKSNI